MLHRMTRNASRRRVRMLPMAVLLLPAAAFASQAARAAPPPPAPSPAELASPIEGYDLRTLYQLWRYWVEAHKGAAADRLLASPDVVEGYAAAGRPFLRFKKMNDFGHFMSGEVRSYCPAAAAGGRVEDSCHFRLRRAYVAAEAGDFDANPVSRWTRESFDAAKIVARVKALALPPQTDWWRADRQAIFSALPSPLEMLAANATLARLDSRECKRLAVAVSAMDEERLSWRTDVRSVGSDTERVYPGPHSIHPVWSLDIVTPSGGSATIEGSGKDLHAIVGPVLAAADACEAAGTHRSAAGD